MGLSEFEERSPANSAVMVLYERASDSLILTKRRENLRAHPGEVCFPGGGWEEGDADLYATGLRELHEELGITGDRVHLIRALEPQPTLLGKVIQPWFAQIESVNPYQINPDEVARLIMVPMSLVQAARNYKDIVVERGRFRFKSCEFVYHGDWVWGATAKIMKQLIIEP
jgi:8-oxo-dGTP pyrophosphatase MutT (NUDIX family)